MVAATSPTEASAAGGGVGAGQPRWRKLEGLLASLYGFTHMGCSSLQDEQSVRCFCVLVAQFVESLRGDEPWLFGGRGDLEALQRAAAFVGSPATAAGGGMRWFPQYGAALAVLPPHGTQAVPGSAWLRVLALDDWGFRLHSKADRSAQHTSTCEGSRLLPCGALPQTQERLSAYLARLDGLLAKAQERHDEQRSSHGSKRQGHQKTPALIHALALQALQQEPEDGQKEQERPPRGGFTDVGLHTGGTPRDTAWPLVREAFKAALNHCLDPRAAGERPAALSAVALAHMHLCLAQRHVELIGPAAATSTALNAAMQMLEAATSAAAELAEGGCQLDGFEDACLAVRRKLEAAAAARALQAAERATLPPLDDGKDSPCGPGSYRCPCGVVPPQRGPSEEAAGLEAAKRRAAANLGSLPMPAVAAEGDPVGWLDALQAALEQCTEHGGSSDMTAQHALSMVELELFSRAASAGRLQDAEALGEAGVQMLYEVVQSYRRVLEGFLASPASAARMCVELRSRGLLVTWVAYCMTDAAACTAYPLVASYGVSLRADDLRHLVLSDRQACDALLGVAAYLRQRQGQPLFSLADSGCATLRFADSFAAADGGMAGALQLEQAAAAARQAEHWRRVQAKQREAAQIRPRLQREKQELAAAERAYASAVEERDGYLYDRHGVLQAAVNNAARRVSSARAAVNKSERQLNEVLAAPRPVIQPLPQDTSQARQTIFFAYCPQLLRRLAALSFLAQQLLVPTEGLQPEALEQAMDCIGAAGPRTQLIDHYNQCQDSPYVSDAGRRGAESQVVLVSDEVAMTEGELLQRLPTVDSYHLASDGVWHPDGLLPRMAWQGSGVADAITGWFDPWGSVPASSVAEGFTEQLAGEAAVLQWAMPQYGSGKATSADRGNLAIAQQHQQPRWISKPGFLALGALRSYPLLQLRHLCVALRQRALPLGHPAVRTLVRQALYHVGTLTSGEQPALLWRTEWGSGGSSHGDLLETLHDELQGLAEELRESPREADAVLLLGEMAAFLAGWHPPLRAVARNLAATAARWADSLEAEAAAAPPQDAVHLRAQQAKLRMTALCCYGGGGGGAALSPEDAAAMLRLAALAHHGSAYCHALDGAGTAELQAQLSQLEVLCHWAMARRASEVVAAANSQPSMLKAALAAVMQHTHDVRLQWEQLSHPTAASLSAASWQAVGSDGHLYSINGLDGTVLEDGTPPGRLPAEILRHPLYTRTFSTVANGSSSPWGFEVTKTASGVRRSLAPVRGCFYEFHLAADGGLVAVEVDGSGNRLELLDVGGEGCPCPGWGADLPPRLRQMHSHWLCRERGVIVLRPVHFRDRQAHYLLHWPTAGGADQAVSYTCLRVPEHLQRRSWLALLAPEARQALTDQLVLHSSAVTAVLAQFESSCFIHTYIRAGGGNASDDSIADGSSTSTSRDGHRRSCKRGRQASSDSSGSAGAAPAMLFSLSRFQLEFELQGGCLWSHDFTGWRLRPCQRLVEQPAGDGGTAVYTLPDFSQCLILERPGQPEGGAAALQVLVPAGQVQRGPESVTVLHSGATAAQLTYHTYTVHPRLRHLHTASIPARMQLAALQAATSSLLPEPGSQATGAQQAMQTVRACWGTLPPGLSPGSPGATHPLTAADLQQLANAATLGGHLAAGLRLLVHDALQSACQLSALHFTDLEQPPAQAQPQPCPEDWQLAYLEEGSRNLRLLLTAAEELRTLGECRPPLPPPLWQRLGLCTPVDVPACPVSSDVVADSEAALAGLLQPAQPANGAAGQPDGAGAQPVPPPYPLVVGGGEGAGEAVELERQMHAELQESWELHHQDLQQLEVAPDARRHIAQLQADVRTWRSEAEAYLLTHLAAAPAALGLPGAAFRMRRAAGLLPLPSQRDLLELVLPHCRGARALNPFLSAASVERLRDGALLWLQLCVLEDKLARLAGWAEDAAELPLLIQELQVRRLWSPSAHPYWLVFEAEQQLQIRPAQYTVAQHLMGHPGAICQLNMGEGKTRVIMPMLLLHYAAQPVVVRLVLLPQLLAEAYSYMHACLCASSLARKLYLLPFHRDVRPTPQLLSAMRSALEHCKQEGGVLLTSPERLLSFELKRQELWEQGQAELVAQMDGLRGLPFQDLLDESDELLSHRFQLVYAWGSPTGLPSEQIRTAAGHALLLQLARHATAGRIGAILARERVAVVAGREGKPGAYPGVRLLPGAALEAALPELRQALAEAVVADPPYAQRWLAQLDERARALVLRCCLDRGVPAKANLAASGLAEEQREFVLALRGLLAFGVLEHCLRMRVHVEFGVNRSPNARKRLAVPFRAALTPSERSEYARPDTALTLTDLAYYKDGLSLGEFLDALHELLKRGQNEQRACYGEWLQLARRDVEDAGALVPVDDVRKLDPTNAVQMGLVHSIFSHNMAAVNFWISYCLVPREMRMYPGRLPASAWHLANNPGGRVVGFSGTNDNHRLLPLQVAQHLDVERSLQATNGKMLAVLLGCPRFDTLPALGALEVCRALLRFAVQHSVDAVIDCGALLAGTTNSKAAEHLVGLMLAQPCEARWRGVCFFDESRRAWMVLDLQRRLMPREVSPIREDQALCIYDEARCRGADLRLRPDALGLLTLGPTTCKDKLMQAAGRLRKLGRGQTLRTIATEDVGAKIRAVARAAAAAAAGGAGAGAAAAAEAEAAVRQLTSRDVLQWAMANTVAATLHGVLEWAHQGLLFAASHGAPEHWLQPEQLGLDELYGAASSPAPLGEIVETQHERRQRADLAADMAQLMADLAQRSAAYGAGHSVMAHGGVGEECERECEREEEEEEEVERQVPKKGAAAERDWDYRQALRATSLETFSQLTGLQLVPLAQLAQRLHAAQPIAALPWSPRVLCTPNFARAVVDVSASDALNEYLRSVGSMLLLPAGAACGSGSGSGSSKAAAGPAVVLLSEREANALLELAWAGRGSGFVGKRPVPLLACLAYAAAVQQPGLDGQPVPLRLATALRSSGFGWAVPGALDGALRSGAFMPQLVSAQLFDGETTYVPQRADAQWADVRQARALLELANLAGSHAPAAEALVDMHGKASFFLRSQLERACTS